MAFLFLLLATAQLVAAHFGLEYPEWRVNRLTNKSYSQWTYPCAGVPSGAGNRTDWPLSGGSLKLDLHHPWTYVFINLGLGSNVTNFNITLTPSFWNETGNGTLCVPQLPLPVSVNDGQQASIQVVTVGDSGSALYNCADITFRSSAKVLSDNDCKNDTGVSIYRVGQQSATSTTNSTSSTNSSTSTGRSSATGARVSLPALMSVVTIAIAFAVGL